jgi:hypothetical protein
MSLTYVIIEADDVQNVTGWAGETVMETSPDTLRWNIDPAETKTFVKFRSSDPTPSFLEGKTQYTHSEILEILATSEWSPPFPPQ